jgi:hypothetical protein
MMQDPELLHNTFFKKNCRARKSHVYCYQTPQVLTKIQASPFFLMNGNL